MLSTVRSEVRSGAIRIDITDTEQWSAGDTAILRNQEAKKVRDIGSLIFETPIQHGYEAGAEVRSLLPTERLEEINGHLAVTDDDPQNPGTRRVRFWVDGAVSNPSDGRSYGEKERYHSPESARVASPTHVTPERRERMSPVQEHMDRNQTRESPSLEPHQKIRFLEVVHCIRWSRCESGSVRVQI